MVLQDLAYKVDELLRRAVDLPQEPAFHDAGKGDDIELRHHVDIRRGAVWVQGADLPTDLLHGAVDDGVDVCLKELLEGVPAQGTEGAEAEGPVFLQIAEKLQKPLLPEQGPFVLFQQGEGFLLKGPAEQTVNIFKMVIEILAADPAALRQIVNGDFVQRLLGH